MTPASATVAICAYSEDRWDDLVAAVRSVEAQNPRRADQLLVVIDHNEALFRRAADALTGAEVVRSSGPRGLSGARNSAIERSTGEFVAFLDDDATARPDWLSRLLVHFDDPTVLGVGGRALPAWDTSAPTWFPDEFLWVVGSSHRGLPTEAGRVRNVIGCNMAMRADVLRKVDGFDVDLGRTADRPLGCEETELCIRAVELVPDGQFVLEPAAVVTHRVPAARATWSYYLSRCRAEGESKAWVAARVGGAAATATERQYVTRTLPAAFGRALVDVVRGDRSGAGRAGAIVVGLATTSASYGLRRLRRQTHGAGASAATGPLATFVIDRSAELPLLERTAAPDDTPYVGAHCLVLDGDVPAGVVVVPFVDDTITPDRLASAFGSLPAATPRRRRARNEAISVIVATRDRPAALERCLRSVLGGSLRPERVVVVDNAPADEAAAGVVARLTDEFAELLYVREDRPGLATAHNRGLLHIDTPLVAFTDDDVVAGSEWLASLVAAFVDDDRIACVTGAIVPLELDTPTQLAIEAVSGFNKGWTPDTFDPDDTDRGPLFPYAAGTFGSGANMAFRSAHLRCVGGFDDALGAGTISLGGDDLAAFYDVLAAGRRLRYEPAAFVRHQHHRHPDALARQAYGYGAGLTAHLTRCVVRDPRVLLRFARAAGPGVRRARAISAPSGTAQVAARRGPAVRGMASGVVRYLVARRRAQRFARDRESR